jgi:ketosteroid isomerase-like protein
MPSSDTAEAMTEENVEVLRRLYGRWERGDLHTAEFFDAEVEIARIGSELPGINGEWRGLDGFGVAMTSYLDALADLRVEAERMIDLGDDRVLVLSRQTARGKTSALPFDSEFGDLFTFRNGKILRYASYWDRADALAAAGLSE